MTGILRLSTSLAEQIAEDLARPHAHAFERVGFVFARWASTGTGIVVLPFEYMPVADERYIEDAYVGAKIDGPAIRAALQKTLNERVACLHVHAHSPGMPFFGGVDHQEQAKLVPSFVATVPEAPHGALLLYGTGMTARIMMTGALIDVERVVEVGFPLRVSRRRS